MFTLARTVFDRTMQLLAGVLILALLVCVTLGIVTRALGNPLIWTDEVSRFLMLWTAVCGWVIASRRRAHIRIRFFHDLLPPRLWRLAEIVMQAAMVVFGVLAGWYSLHLAAVNWDLEATTVEISIAWLYLPVIFAGFVTAAQGLAELIENVRDRALSPYNPAEPPVAGKIL
jgi:TRAP-type C4-dicarboxylate transport system permease small subunit